MFITLNRCCMITAIKVPSFSYSDKLAHTAAYGVLASLIYVALKKGNVANVSDEIHQYFVPGRQGDIFDVMANGIGALCFPAAFQYYEGRSKARFCENNVALSK